MDFYQFPPTGYWWRIRRPNHLSSLLDESNEGSLPCLSTRLLGEPGMHPAEIERGGREDLLQMDFDDLITMPS
jgi:hypothetical protein